MDDLLQWSATIKLRTTVTVLDGLMIQSMDAENFLWTSYRNTLELLLEQQAAFTSDCPSILHGSFFRVRQWFLW